MPWDRNSLKHCKVERKSHTMVMNVALPLDFWLMACPFERERMPLNRPRFQWEESLTL